MSIVDELKTRLQPDFLKYQFEGCIQDELDELARTQQVNCLPKTYCEVMLFMGRQGLSWIVGADATIETLRNDLKPELCAGFEYSGLAYPTDVFVFSDHDATQYTFFRTAKCEDDPPVFESIDGDYCHKLADSFSAYILWQVELYLMPDREARMRSIEQYAAIRQTLYCYDAIRDEMLER